MLLPLETPFITMEISCLYYSQCSHLNVLTIFPPNWVDAQKVHTVVVVVFTLKKRSDLYPVPYFSYSSRQRNEFPSSQLVCSGHVENIGDVADQRAT